MIKEKSIFVKRTIWIAAACERMWQAITDPKQILQWFSPGTPWELTALDVGGAIYAVGYESQTGIIEVVNAPRQFTYRWVSATPTMPYASTTTYTLEEEIGFGMLMENLQAYFEGTVLPYPQGF